MGSNRGQDAERPVHRVWIDEFNLASAQITVGEYSVFLRDTGHTPPPFWNSSGFHGPDLPVVAVSWFEAVAFCDWLSQRTGLRYRLPTEAEWERAARGGLEGKEYPWGDELPRQRSGYGARWKNGPEPVRRSEPNGYGLFEMCENVHEWCTDWFQPGYYLTSPERNPKGPPEGKRKSSRGGSWRHRVRIARCSARSSIPPGFHYADYGFRPACDVR